jgi:hypothetical protein
MIDFPNAPTNGQTFIIAGVTWIYLAWLAEGNALTPAEAVRAEER